MTLQEIASFIQNTIRYKLSPEQVILIIDATQKLAFDNDSKMFLVWSTFTPYFEITFESSGYTSAIAGDVGKTVVGADSGAEGVLISYNNTTRVWTVTNTNETEFTDGEAVTITTGTGAGTVSDFAGYTGPYDAPTSPPTRKIWGITRETDNRIFGNDENNDYDFASNNFDPSTFFEQAREDNLNRQITLIVEPTVNAVYRWVYYRDAETITDIETASDSKLLIPSRYHMQFVNACKKMADIAIFGEDLDPQDVKALLGGWWESSEQPYTPMGKVTNRQLWPRQGSSVLI
jgi:hypothetical protein